MALPTPTPTGFAQIPNNGFEDGATGWTTSGTANIVNEPAISGSWCVKVAASGEANDGAVISSTMFPVVPGQSINLNALGKMTTGTPGTSFSVVLYWYDSAGAFISSSSGAQVSRAAIGGNQGTASVSATAPSNAAFVKPAGSLNTSNSSTTSTIYMDNFSWNYSNGVAVELTHPISSYDETTEVPFRVNIQGLPSGITVSSVEYFYMTYDGSDYIGPVSIATVTTAPYAHNAPAFSEGQYGAYAIVTLSNGLTLTTNSRVFVVGEVAPPDTREFKASNSYTYLVAENFANLSSSLPSTSIVTGAEVILEYSLDVLVRSADIDIDPAASNPEVAFAVVSSGNVEAVLLDKNNDTYTINGAPMSASVPINVIDFDIDEEGMSDDKKWTVYTLEDTATVTLGAEALLFGQVSIDAPSFVNKALGVRFFPTLGSKPDYADTGEACYRFKINTLKIRVYFDAGSVEYYFADSSKTNVIKGELVAGNVTNGDLRNGDAEGVLQLSPELEVIDGSGDTIQDGWTIHSAYPPSDLNQIGVVVNNMAYNRLPTYFDVESNRSRYLFITANFYGDPDWDSIYGVNGVDRAFAYNGEDFYKIFTRPEADKDKPRHVAYHHTHLALGYGEGRVDISVVGEPYNFSGLDGASSWAIGDNVTGLLPLSGTILGIFCKKSVVGLSGTTVDNFATQTLSAKLGAIEYTVTDIGFPVYANTYGIYTLSQTQEYGDFLGLPLSQQISPWLRPRLIRKKTSDKEVVVAWPVRSKNQYRLAFADGYILSMTMNYGNQSTPTFSKQVYEVSVESEVVPIVPAALSSELDDNGEERIHVANKQVVLPPTPALMSGIAGPGSLYIGNPVPAGTVVDWGDGNVETADSITQMSHSYPDESSEWVWKILEMPGSMAFNSRLYVGGSALREVTTWPLVETWADANSGKGPIFGEVGSPAVALRSVPSSLPSNVTDLSQCFKDCAYTTAIAGIDSWNTNNITSMGAMFENCTALESLNLSGWNVANVNTMEAMFSNCLYITDPGISNWNTVNVLSMKNMFSGSSSFSADLNWDVSKVLDMSGMFFSCAAFNGNISNWNTSACADMSRMFYSAATFNRNINTWDVSKVTTMKEMFAFATSYNQPMSSWDTAECTDMSWMFWLATAFNQSLAGWDTGAVTTMEAMFNAASSFNGDVTTWNTANVYNMARMFENASVFNKDLSGWNTSSVINMDRMFQYANMFNGDVSTWDTSNVLDMTSMFSNTASNPDLSNWNVENVTTMYNMFYLNSVFNGDLSGWVTTNLRDVRQMFWGATSFNSNISGWKTGLISRNNMASMFRNASSFNQNLSGWCVSSISTAPSNFNTGATAWVLPKPVWGTCPGGP